MSDKSTIEWTDATWNPVTGCSKVSPGCAHCYAETFAERWRGTAGHPYEQGFDLQLWPERLSVPLRWRKPRRVFVNSMSDLFHEDIPWEFIATAFAVMSIAEQHTFQVLTKRPALMRAALTHPMFWVHLNTERLRRGVSVLPGSFGEYAAGRRVLSNVWLGVSIENRRFVHRADVLRRVPAAVRFISAEPLLGPLVPSGSCVAATNATRTGEWSKSVVEYRWRDGRHGDDPGLNLTGIDWLIVGGESGPKHRPIAIEWVRDLRDACLRPGPCSSCEVWNAPGAQRENRCGACGARPRPSFFFKQWGGHRPKAGGRELDGRTWDEFPAVTA